MSEKYCPSCFGLTEHVGTVCQVCYQSPMRLHHNSKLTFRTLLEIKAKLDAGIAQTAIAKRYGISQVTVSNIKNGKRYSSIFPNQQHNSEYVCQYKIDGIVNATMNNKVNV